MDLLGYCVTFALLQIVASGATNPCKCEQVARFPAEWFSWSAWSTCSVTCGGGKSTRSRECNRPGFQNHFCIVNKHCGVGPCIVDGEWSEWGQWTGCSVTCGNGTRSRSRSCNNPAPTGGGRNCTGSSTETGLCDSRVVCEVDGVWSEWGQWNGCSVTCGNGTRSRSRSCDNPAPTGGGRNCTGSYTEIGRCQTQIECQEPWTTSSYSTSFMNLMNSPSEDFATTRIITNEKMTGFRAESFFINVTNNSAISDIVNEQVTYGFSSTNHLAIKPGERKEESETHTTLMTRYSTDKFITDTSTNTDYDLSSSRETATYSTRSVQSITTGLSTFLTMANIKETRSDAYMSTSQVESMSKEHTVDPLESTSPLSLGITTFDDDSPLHGPVTEVEPITEEVTFNPRVKTVQWKSGTSTTGLYVTDILSVGSRTPESDRKSVSQPLPSTAASTGRDVLGTEAEFRTKAYSPTATLKTETSTVLTEHTKSVNTIGNSDDAGNTFGDLQIKRDDDALTNSIDARPKIDSIPLKKDDALMTMTLGVSIPIALLILAVTITAVLAAKRPGQIKPEAQQNDV